MVSYGFKQPTLNRVTKKNVLLILPRMIPILRKKKWIVGAAVKIFFFK